LSSFTCFFIEESMNLLAVAIRLKFERFRLQVLTASRYPERFKGYLEIDTLQANSQPESCFKGSVVSNLSRKSFYSPFFSPPPLTL
jgi:hypothetical protein